MFTILGAGNGGLAMAGYLEAKGLHTTIWNRSRERLDPLVANNNVIEVHDHVNKAVTNIKVSRVTYSLQEAIIGAKYIIIITPGTAHRELAEQLTPLLTEEQVIVLMPGRTYGSMEFIEVVNKHRGFIPQCYETQTILHTCRAQAHIVDQYATKPKVLYAGYKMKSEPHDGLTEIFPEFEFTDDYFSVTLSNMGAMLHPVTTLLNAGRVDKAVPFAFYHEGVTPAIAVYLENLDKERQEVCNKLGCRSISLKEWIKQEYGSDKGTLYDSVQAVTAYTSISGPKTLDHRYIYDDLLTGLVPIYYTGQAFGLKMSYTEAAIYFISKLMEYDFLEKGRKFNLNFAAF